MNGTIIKKAEEEIMLEDLREENRMLRENCNNLMFGDSNGQIEQQYKHMSV